METNKLNTTIQYAIEVTLRLGFLLLLIGWCLQIIFPFAGVIIWGVILAMAAAPFYNLINKSIGNRPKMAAVILIILFMVIIIIPSWLFLDSLILGARNLYQDINSGTLQIPPPQKSVQSWPILGGKLYEVWTAAAQNLSAFVLKYKDQIIDIGGSIFSGAISVGSSIVQFVIAAFIAGVLLATSGTREVATKFFQKLVGDRAGEFAEVVEVTVRNVVKGVIGMAFIQAFLIGLGFLLAGVPYAGLWTLIVLVLAILQLPPLLVIVPVVIYLFSSSSTLVAVCWTVYLLLAGASDNFLKPMLLGKGALVPMLVIFLGVIGGFMTAGFIGMFTGAIILSLGYKLFLSWLNTA